jgi:hypothetical protein
VKKKTKKQATKISPKQCLDAFEQKIIILGFVVKWRLLLWLQWKVTTYVAAVLLGRTCSGSRAQGSAG